MSPLRVLAAPYALEILRAVASGPRRFSELGEACPHDRTRTVRLRELRNLGLLRSVPVPVRGREVLAYGLTDKGRVVLKRVGDLERVFKV